MMAPRPRIGDVVQVAAVPELADVPARVIRVWPRMRSGEYLVTVEYSTLVQIGRDRLLHLDVFARELETEDA